MKNNHHYEQANIGQDYFEGPALNDHAAVQATLALAYEQRTANLIAWFGDGTHGDASKELHAEIVSRLGLSK
jgi:hypothetical protein